MRWFVVFISILFIGCGSASEIKKYDIIIKPSVSERVETVLKRYVEGNPVGSELRSFEGYISDASELDKENHALIKSVYEQLQASPDNAAAIASSALEKLKVKPAQKPQQ